MTAPATIVIPWRDNGCPYRRANLTTVQTHIAGLGWPVILADRPGEWNVSAARNTGVAAATTDVVVIMDADMVIPLGRLTTAVERVAHTNHVIHPYDVVEYLNQHGKIRRRLPHSPGGCTIIRRDTYNALGGHDENYHGWGYEDTDFNTRADVFGVEWLPGPATHQWHPPDKDVTTPQFKANQARYNALTTSPTPPDVVYRVRPGDTNDELRYSLRSLANIPHGKVWIVGHKPTWTTGIGHLPGDRHTTKWANAFDGILRACQDPRISPTFILMDDDMMILQPVTTITPWHYCSLDQHIEQAQQGRGHGPGWITSLTNTSDYLHAHGCTNPISWEIHVPFLIDRATSAPLLEAAAHHSWPIPPQARTVIANLTGRTGQWRQDVKIRPPHLAFAPDLLSTSDSTIDLARERLHARFPKPSQWETGPKPPAPQGRTRHARLCTARGCHRLAGNKPLCPTCEAERVGVPT